MQGYQFGHVETWSRAGSTGSIHHESGEGANTRRWTTAEILAEAERETGASFHVEPGGPPPQIIPGACADFAELRAAHAAAAGIKESFDYNCKKTKKKSVRVRSLRRDARTLYTAIFSLPVETQDALDDPALKMRCLALLQDAIEHERHRIEALGGVVAMSVVHWDEAMVHVHVYALHPEKGRVDALHPGVAAKADCVNDPRAIVLSKQDRNKAGNRAYRAAMREWQDDLHEDVFGPAGLLRVGPKRERLSRRDYLHSKKAAAERRVDRERQAEIADGFSALNEMTETVVRTAEADLELAREWEADLTEREAAVAVAVERAAAERRAADAARDEAVRKEAAAARQLREAGDALACAEAKTVEIAAREAAIECDLAEAKRDREAAAQDRAATERYFEITPMALAKGEVRIAEDEEEGAVLSAGKRAIDAASRAEIDAAHLAAPKPVRRSLARAWRQVTDAARAAIKPFQPDGLLGKWRGAFDYLKVALIRDQERIGAGDDITSATPCETAVVALAAAVRDEDRSLSDDLRRAALIAQRRRTASETGAPSARDDRVRSERTHE
jgi:hypothetical protein